MTVSRSSSDRSFCLRQRSRSAVASSDLVIAALIVVAIVVAILAMLRMDIWGERAGDRNRRAGEELRRAARIDPALIRYRQTGQFAVGLDQARGLAVGPDDRIYVAGDRMIRVFDDRGERLSQVSLDGQPKCLAVGHAEHAMPGRIYVGMADHVETVGADGRRQAKWDSPGKEALLTSIAVGQDDVFVADAGNHLVWRYDTSGGLQGRIEQRDAEGNVGGFAIPSAYFDVAVAPTGLLYVVHPAALRLEAYTSDGERVLHWGEKGSAIEAFFGCCNPAHFAILPDGRFVTAEKGLHRIKVYAEDGTFECVVAGPRQIPAQAADVATDSRGRVLILDPSTRSVRIFEHKATDDGATP